MAIALGASGVDGHVTFRAVALTGETASTVSGDPVFTFFGSDPQLNNAGEVAFYAGLAESEDSAATSYGIFREGPSSPSPVAFFGAQAPGLPPGVTLSLFGGGRLAFNDAGQLSFVGILTGAGVASSNDQAVFFAESGQLAGLLARTGDQAAGLPAGVNYSSFTWSSLLLNNAGQTAFYAGLAGTGVDASNNRAIFRDAPGTGIAVIVRAGDQAVGLPAGVVLTNLGYPALDSAGRTACFSPLAGPGVDFSNQTAIFSEGGGAGLIPITRKGDPAPHLNSAATFNSLLGYPRVNDLGHTAFFANLSGAEITHSNDMVFYVEKAGSGLSLIAREAQPAADLAEAGYFYSDFSDYQINNSGDIALHSYLTGWVVGPNDDEAIFLDRGGAGFTTVAHEGDQAPGLPAGVHYASLSYGSLQLNDAGQVAFSASLVGDGVTESNDRAIFATDSLGEVQLIAAEGDLFDTNADPDIVDLRTIASFSLSESLNEAGDLLFHASFTDGSSGLFVASIGSSLPGDYNADGVVDAADYTVWRDSHGSTTSLAADGDGDRTIGEGDYAIWSQHYGANGSGGFTPVPEPTAAALLAIGWLAASRRHGRDA